MFDVNKQSGSFTARIAMASISPGYEVNDIGFQTEADRIMLDTHLTWRQPRPGTWLRNWNVSGGPDGKWNTAGDRLHSEFNVNLGWQWLNYWGGSIRGVVGAPTDNDPPHPRRPAGPRSPSTMPGTRICTPTPGSPSARGSATTGPSTRPAPGAIPDRRPSPTNRGKSWNCSWAPGSRAAMPKPST